MDRILLNASKSSRLVLGLAQFSYSINYNIIVTKRLGTDTERRHFSNEKGNDNTKDSHILNFICFKVTLFSYFVQTRNPVGVFGVKMH